MENNSSRITSYVKKEGEKEEQEGLDKTRNTDSSQNLWKQLGNIYHKHTSALILMHAYTLYTD